MPGHGVWIDVNVSTCSSATFDAPSDSGPYVPNDSYRTTLITGYVRKADFHDPELVAKQAAGRPVRSSLPAVDSRIALVLRQWDAGICSRIGPALKMPVKRFRVNYMCDTLPLRGPCLPPLLLADLID